MQIHVNELTHEYFHMTPKTSFAKTKRVLNRAYEEEEREEEKRERKVEKEKEKEIGAEVLRQRNPLDKSTTGVSNDDAPDFIDRDKENREKGKGKEKEKDKGKALESSVRAVLGVHDEEHHRQRSTQHDFPHLSEQERSLHFFSFYR